MVKMGKMVCEFKPIRRRPEMQKPKKRKIGILPEENEATAAPSLEQLAESASTRIYNFDPQRRQNGHSKNQNLRIPKEASSFVPSHPHLKTKSRASPNRNAR